MAVTITGNTRVIGQTTVGVTPTTILDLYPYASVAYSLRKLRNDYTGSAIRVRRSSDNTEQDIGFNGNDLDETALTTFVGASSGFVTTWYDQSGNLRNVTQSTQTNQPRIVNSGTIDREKGKPTIVFDGTNDRLTSTTLSFGTTDYSVFLVSKSGGIDSNGRSPFSIMPSSANANGWINYVYRSNITNTFRTGYSSDGGTGNAFAQFPLNTYPVVQALVSNIIPNSGNITFNLNGIQQATNTAIGQTINNAQFWVGNYFSTNNYYHQGTINEIIVYMSNQGTNRTGIEQNINAYYNIY